MIRAFGPGRVNLIGEHTDYNGGLGAAVRDRPRRHRRGRARATTATIRARGAATSASATRFAAARSRRARDGWRAFVRGTVAELRAAGVAAARARGSRSPATCPRGSGLSSSAALEAALAPRAARASPAPTSPTASSSRKLCSRVENDWVGAETGLLDQLASLCGRERRARCGSTSPRSALEPVPLDLGDWRLVTLDSGAEHVHAAGGYNERRAECRAACAALGIEHAQRGRRRTRPPRCPSRSTAARATSSPRTRASTRWSPRCARGDLRGGRAAARRLAREPARRLRGQRARGRGTRCARCKDAGAAGARMVGGGFGGSVLALFPPGADAARRRRRGSCPARPRAARAPPAGPTPRPRPSSSPERARERPDEEDRRDHQHAEPGPQVDVARRRPCRSRRRCRVSPRITSRTPQTPNTPPMMRRRSNRFAAARRRASPARSSACSRCARPVDRRTSLAPT